MFKRLDLVTATEQSIAFQELRGSKDTHVDNPFSLQTRGELAADWALVLDDIDTDMQQLHVCTL